MSKTSSTTQPGDVTSRPSEGFLDMDGAAKLLGVSKRWIQEAVTRPPDQDGSIPHHLLPCPGTRKQRRFDPEELRAWVHADCPPVADWRWVAKTFR